MKTESDCRDVQRLCDQSIDGELGSELRLAMLRHLKSCEACSELIEERTLLKRLVRSSAAVLVVPDAVRLRIVGGIRGERSCCD